MPRPSSQPQKTNGRPVMGRSLTTGPAEVTREQARYRRLMQLSSARSVEMGRVEPGPPRDALAPLSENSLTVKDDPAAEGSRRPASQQHWPRKLEPLPSRLAAPDTPDPCSFAPMTRTSPGSTSPLAAAMAEGVRHEIVVEAIVKEDSGARPPPRSRANRLRSLPSEDEDSGEENTPFRNSRPRSNTCPNLLETREDGGQNKSWSPFCMSTTMVAALTPLNMKSSPNESGNSPSELPPASPTNSGPGGLMKTMTSVTMGIAAAPTMHRNTGRRPTRLSPLHLGEAAAAAAAQDKQDKG